MLSHKILVLALVFLIFPTIFFIETTVAEDERESIVDATFNIEMETATDLKLSVTMSVYEMIVFDKTYDNSEIHNLATSTNLSDAQTLGAIKLNLRNLLKNQIKKSFENATVFALNDMPSYEDTHFHDDYSVNLTSAFFGLNQTVSAYELINGVLDMDAIVYYTFNLQAEHGWNNTYTFILPDSLKYRYTTGTADTNKIQWMIKNWDGNNSETLAELSIQMVEPTTPSTTTDDISLEFLLDASNVDLVGFKTTIIAETIDIRSYEILPDFITELAFIPSDGLRLFIDNGLLNLDKVYNNTIKHIEQLSIQTIENSSFSQNLETTFNWSAETTTNCSNPYNITNMDNYPPIKAELIDEDVRLVLCGMSSRAFFGLINSGGNANLSSEDINFGDDLNNIGFPYTINLQLPNNITIDGNNTQCWNQTTPISGEFVSEDSPEYSNEDIQTYVEIDISKMDLDLPSFFTGETKLTTTSQIKEETSLYVMHFPPEFSISEKINLTLLNSDAFRLCTEENVFTPEDIEGYLTNKKVIFNTRLSNVLNDIEIQGVVDKSVFYDSLKWDGDIANMDEVNPIKTSISSHNIYPVAFNISFLPPELSITNQIFTLSGIEDKAVTYRIIFPKGISIKVKETLNRTVLQGQTNDERAYVEVSFSGNEAETERIECMLSASSLYLLGLFMPCLLSFILVIILIIIVFFIRKKTRGRRVKKEPESTGYEDQEYYVPPPSSK